ncbi:MAG: 2-C-methyl-D-erythritol 4-phosphate cytidylyltransferase [Candidatus Omnitrophica bacterium]|nr:2-C-methyl-D-erythritol 4-phosphate cytidylyltransferase [Candidatus Omnitrophota bacterium]
MTYVSAIVVAAGKGKRFKHHLPKPLVKINGRPVIVYALEALSRHPAIKDIIVVTNSDNKKDIKSVIEEFRIQKIAAVVNGGRRRQDSVSSGLRYLHEKTDIVLIHDGVRPFIDRDIISRTIKKAKSCGAAIVGVPVKATIKKVKELTVQETIDRQWLWEIQTPQVFKKELILRAYAQFADTDVTDDAMLVEKLGVAVKVCPSLSQNIKITTLDDLIIAEAIARRMAL